MHVYAKIWNADTKQVFIALGNDAAFYTEQGFEQMEVEKGWDGNWYVAGHVPPKSDMQVLRDAKIERAAAVASITVEVDGMTFDGNETAQERMARAVLMAESPEETTEWVLADSSVAVVTAEQLRRACRAAGKAQGALWVVPYQN